MSHIRHCQGNLEFWRSPSNWMVTPSGGFKDWCTAWVVMIALSRVIVLGSEK